MKTITSMRGVNSTFSGSNISNRCADIICRKCGRIAEFGVWFSEVYTVGECPVCGCNEHLRRITHHTALGR